MTSERQQKLLIRNLDRAGDALRSNLHMHGVNETARMHMERALNHLREGVIAVQEEGRARSVDQLASQLQNLAKILATLKPEAGSNTANKAIHP